HACDPASPLADGTGCVMSVDDAVCGDGVACTTDLCDPNDAARDDDGCVHLPDDDACLSDNPCMAGSCHPTLGCQFSPLPDFSPCDDGTPGVATDYCISGSCRSFQVGF